MSSLREKKEMQWHQANLNEIRERNIQKKSQQAKQRVAAELAASVAQEAEQQHHKLHLIAKEKEQAAKRQVMEISAKHEQMEQQLRDEMKREQIAHDKHVKAHARDTNIIHNIKQEHEKSEQHVKQRIEDEIERNKQQSMQEIEQKLKKRALEQELESKRHIKKQEIDSQLLVKQNEYVKSILKSQAEVRRAQEVARQEKHALVQEALQLKMKHRMEQNLVKRQHEDLDLQRSKEERAKRIKREHEEVKHIEILKQKHKEQFAHLQTRIEQDKITKSEQLQAQSELEKQKEIQQAILDEKRNDKHIKTSKLRLKRALDRRQELIEQRMKEKLNMENQNNQVQLTATQAHEQMQQQLSLARMRQNALVIARQEAEMVRARKMMDRVEERMENEIKHMESFKKEQAAKSQEKENNKINRYNDMKNQAEKQAIHAIEKQATQANLENARQQKIKEREQLRTLRLMNEIKNNPK